MNLAAEPHQAGGILLQCDKREAQLCGMCLCESGRVGILHTALMQVAPAGIREGHQDQHWDRELQVSPQLSTLNSPPTCSLQQVWSCRALHSHWGKLWCCMAAAFPERQSSACPCILECSYPPKNGHHNTISPGSLCPETVLRRCHEDPARGTNSNHGHVWSSPASGECFYQVSYSEEDGSVTTTLDGGGFVV